VMAGALLVVALLLSAWVIFAIAFMVWSLA
jgi:hypothetical protein